MLRNFDGFYLECMPYNVFDMDNNNYHGNGILYFGIENFL